LLRSFYTSNVKVVDENLKQPKLITMDELTKDYAEAKKAMKSYTRQDCLDIFKSMKNFDLNADFKREIKRGLCPVLDSYTNLKIAGVKGGKAAKKVVDPSSLVTVADKDLTNISGIRVKGNPFKKEPFQKDAWDAISKK